MANVEKKEPIGTPSNPERVESMSVDNDRDKTNADIMETIDTGQVFESEHLTSSWLPEGNKCFVKIEKQGKAYVVSAHIENEEGYGLLSDEEIQRHFLSLYTMPPEQVIKNGWLTAEQVEQELKHMRLKWNRDVPTSQQCENKEEAVEYAQKFLDDRENWLTEAYN